MDSHRKIVIRLCTIFLSFSKLPARLCVAHCICCTDECLFFFSFFCAHLLHHFLPLLFGNFRFVDSLAFKTVDQSVCERCTHFTQHWTVWNFYIVPTQIVPLMREEQRKATAANSDDDGSGDVDGDHDGWRLSRVGIRKKKNHMNLCIPFDTKMVGSWTWFTIAVQTSIRAALLKTTHKIQTVPIIMCTYP